MEFVVVGGGVMSFDVVNNLVEKGVRLLNYYGVMEIGVIVFIFCFILGIGYNYWYLRLRFDLGLELCFVFLVVKLYWLIGYFCGWGGKYFEI